MRLSALSAGRTGSGFLINLMSNDVSRLDMGFIFCHYVWILPFQVSICLIFSFLKPEFVFTLHTLEVKVNRQKKECL